MYVAACLIFNVTPSILNEAESQCHEVTRGYNKDCMTYHCVDKFINFCLSDLYIGQLID